MIAMRGAVALGAVMCGVACGGGKRDADSSSVREASSDSAPAASTSAAPTRGNPRTVLFLGTSLTAGLGLDPDSAYPQLIQRKIDGRALQYQVMNAGVSGETSAGLLRRLDWVLQHPAAVIVVETGANDGLRGQQVGATKATIGRILERIKKDRPEARVVLAQMEAPPNLGKEYTQAFHAMFPALAAEHGVELMPFLLNGVAGFANLNQADGIHPNVVGERKVAENVWRTVEPLLVGP